MSLDLKVIYKKCSIRSDRKKIELQIKEFICSLDFCRLFIKKKSVRNNCFFYDRTKSEQIPPIVGMTIFRVRPPLSHAEERSICSERKSSHKNGFFRRQNDGWQLYSHPEERRNCSKPNGTKHPFFSNVSHDSEQILPPSE